MGKCKKYKIGCFPHLTTCVLSRLPLISLLRSYPRSVRTLLISPSFGRRMMTQMRSVKEMRDLGVRSSPRLHPTGEKSIAVRFIWFLDDMFTVHLSGVSSHSISPSLLGCWSLCISSCSPLVGLWPPVGSYLKRNDYFLKYPYLNILSGTVHIIIVIIIIIEILIFYQERLYYLLYSLGLLF